MAGSPVAPAALAQLCAASVANVPGPAARAFIDIWSLAARALKLVRMNIRGLLCQMIDFSARFHSMPLAGLEPACVQLPFQLLRRQRGYKGLAETVGFEPTRRITSTAFQTAAYTNGRTSPFKAEAVGVEPTERCRSTSFELACIAYCDASSNNPCPDQCYPRSRSTNRRQLCDNTLSSLYDRLL